MKRRSLGILWVALLAASVTVISEAPAQFVQGTMHQRTRSVSDRAGPDRTQAVDHLSRVVMRFAMVVKDERLKRARAFEPDAVEQLIRDSVLAQAVLDAASDAIGSAGDAAHFVTAWQRYADAVSAWDRQCGRTPPLIPIAGKPVPKSFR